MSALAAIITEYAETCRNHPNALGEILRAWAFVGQGFGCYSNFDTRPEFARVTATPREFRFLFGREFEADSPQKNSWGDADSEYLETIEWFKHPTGIEMGWLWDGDGLLAFYVPEIEDRDYSGVIVNGDCKKDNEWCFQERPRASGALRGGESK